MTTHGLKMAKRERLPKGSLEIIQLLEEKGALTQKEIIENLKNRKPRAVRYTVRQLLEKEILVDRANFEDMRSSLIGLNHERLSSITEFLPKNK